MNFTCLYNVVTTR